MFRMAAWRTWVVFLTLSVGVAVLAARWLASPGSPESARASVAVAQAPANPVAEAHLTNPPVRSAPNSIVVGPAASSAANPPAPANPPGVTAAQWQQLTAEMQARADGPAELQRLAAYFEWSDLLRRFREARAGGDGAAELARPVDQGLDERLRQRELSAAEALRVKGAILEATVADATERQQQLKQWAATRIPSATATAAADPRQPQFDRSQAAIVSAWSAQPVALRDPAALARQLDALRSQTFTRTGQSP